MIPLLIAFVIFVAFTSYVVLKFGMLESISAAYYKVPVPMFTLTMFAVGILMGVSGDGWTLAAGSFLCGVGVAAHFRWSAEQKIHIFCAVTAILLGFVSITLMGYWYLTLFYAMAALLVMYSRHPSRTWIIEYMAFMVLFLGLLIEKMQ